MKLRQRKARLGKSDAPSVAAGNRRSPGNRDREHELGLGSLTGRSLHIPTLLEAQRTIDIPLVDLCLPGSPGQHDPVGDRQSVSQRQFDLSVTASDARRFQAQLEGALGRGQLGTAGSQLGHEAVPGIGRLELTIWALAQVKVRISVTFALAGRNVRGAYFSGVAGVG
ncbi:MAG: hypothetical protein HYZ29_34990 [Myxococcales bacterium]|nr:hypothetical protein [Myxococcales bacterium]